jgi:cell volume regulation protein A
MLAGLKLNMRDRRLIAAFGPRGLSSLLLALLPVFAGIPNAEQIFTLTSVVVLLSIVVHGGGTAYFLRRSGVLTSALPAEVLAPLSKTAGAIEAMPERITIEEMRSLRAKGESIVIVDARSNANYDGDSITAAGAVRMDPDDPVRDATQQRLSQRSTLVVYCA